MTSHAKQNNDAPFKVAAAQMVSSHQLDENLKAAASLVAEAAEQGAQLVLLPEYFCLMGKTEGDKLALAEADGTGPIQSFLSDLAKQHAVTLIAGTIPLLADHPKKIRNSTLVYGADGQRLSRYDKIHLFRYRNEKESYDEAHTIEAGAAPVKFEVAGLKIGLSVCYDLRFPELFRTLLPIDMLVVPAAFTYTTGKAHWELLLRARAVENQCYVLACGQGGTHTNGRTTYGHSMLIDPWGNVVECLPEGEGLVISDLEWATLNRVRAQLPALQHRVLC